MVERLRNPSRVRRGDSKGRALHRDALRPTHKTTAAAPATTIPIGQNLRHDQHYVNLSTLHVEIQCCSQAIHSVMLPVWMSHARVGP
eukprot:2544338-Amphidinium_carterae.1